MKFTPSVLIIGSILLLLLDFLTLANQVIFPGNEMAGASINIAITCAVIFCLGIVWAIFEPILKRTNLNTAPAVIIPPVIVPEDPRFNLTALEMTFNRFFAVLLVLTTVPFFLNILTLPTSIIFVVFAFLLWFGKKYHPVVNIIFLIFAAGIYFISIPPLGWGILNGLKEIRLAGFDFSVIFRIAPLIFITCAIRNVFGNILAYFKISATLRNFYYLVSLFIALAILLVYPFFM